MLEEPLLIEETSRYVMFPLKYPDIFDAYKKAMSVFWTSDEVNFAQDLVDLEKLTENERYFINHILAFFAASDGLVCENICLNFSNEVKHAEIKAFYSFQNFMENIHSETYSLLIDTYVKDVDEKNKLFDAVNNYPAIQEKYVWTVNYITNKNLPFAQRLIAFALIEGVFFSSSFASLFWLRHRGLMQGLTFQTSLSHVMSPYTLILHVSYILRLSIEFLKNLLKACLEKLLKLKRSSL